MAALVPHASFLLSLLSDGLMRMIPFPSQTDSSASHTHATMQLSGVSRGASAKVCRHGYFPRKLFFLEAVRRAALIGCPVKGHLGVVRAAGVGDGDVEQVVLPSITQ